MKFNSDLQNSRPLTIILTSLLTIVAVCHTTRVNISSLQPHSNQNDTLWSAKETEDPPSKQTATFVYTTNNPTASTRSNLMVATPSVASVSSHASKSSTLITGKKTKDVDALRAISSSTTTTSSNVQRSSSTSSERTSTTSVSSDLQNDVIYPTYNSSAADTNSSADSKNLLRSSDNIETNSLQWYNVYIFGTSFALLGGLTFYTLTHHIVCLSLSRRQYLVISNVMLCLVCLLRALYTFNPTETRGNDSTVYHLLVYESPTFLLQATVMCFVGGLGVYTDTQWLNMKTFDSSLPVNILVLPYVAVTASYVVILAALNAHLDQSNRRCLHHILRAVSAIWSVTVATLICLLYKKIYKASMRRQSQIIRVTLTKLHIEGTQLPKKLPKPCLCLSARAAFITCILTLVMCVVLVTGDIFSYDDGDAPLTVDQDPRDVIAAGNSGPTWLYRSVLRFCEVIMCLSLSCGLFWSQCGHPCRRLVGTSATSTLWSTLSKHSTIWHAPAESLRRFSDRRRHSSDEGYNCHGMFGIYGTASSHAVSRTNFTFERWERTRRPVPAPTVSEVQFATDAIYPTMPPPILKTFQHGVSCRISPQHLLQSSQLALQRTRRTVSTTVAAGIRSLARSSRSSSSSISSASSVRPSPSKGLTLPPIKQEEIIHWNSGDTEEIDSCVTVGNEFEKGRQRVGKPKFNKRFFGRRVECENRIHKSHVPTDQHLTYVKKKPPSSVRRKPRHLESGKRKVKELANKVLMVSRATQVYIPSPHKNTVDCEDDDDNSVVFHQRMDEMKSRRTFPQTDALHSRRCWLQFGSGGGGGSSTSCSSESAGNSFDVRFYMCSPKSHCRNGSLVDGSSSCQNFHEQYYSGKLNSGHPRSSLDVSCDSTDNACRLDLYAVVPHCSVFEMPRTKISCRADADDSLSNSSQDPSLDSTAMATKQEHKLRHFLPRFRKTSKVDKTVEGPVWEGDGGTSTRGNRRIDISSPSIADGSTSTFNLSLPLEKDTVMCQTSKNHQDITPDSAVYLELNLPENDNEDEEQQQTMLGRTVRQCHVWPIEPNSAFAIRKSISLTSLYKDADIKQREKTASIRRLSLTGLKGEDESSIDQRPGSVANKESTFTCCDRVTPEHKTFVRGACAVSSSSPWKDPRHHREGGGGAIGFMSSSDSVYDSGDESSVVSLENCPRYKQIDFQELTNF